MIATPHAQHCENGSGTIPYPQFHASARPENQRLTSRLNFFEGQAEKLPAARSKIGESIAYMTEHLNQPLQVATLASMVGISPSHYFALFKRHTGCAPMEYFTQLRMAAARQLLDNSASSVKEVAATLGYDDPFYFSRVFKSVNQLAPTNYRMKQRECCRQAENSPCET